MILVDRRITINPAEGFTLRRVSSVEGDVVAKSTEDVMENEEPEAVQKKRGRKKKEGV